MANDIYFTGVSSGLDWGSIVDKLVNIERIPQTKVKLEAAVAGLKKDYWGTLNTKISELQSYSEKLRKTGGDVFSGMKASVTDSKIVSATVTDKNTPASSYSINVTALAAGAVKTGAALYSASDSLAQAASKISSAVINSTGNTVTASQSFASQAANFDTAPAASGAFTINGYSIAWSDTDSLNSVMSKINSSGAGVTASFSAADQKVTLKSNGAGANSQIILSQGSGNLLEALKITAGTVSGSDAVKFAADKALGSAENHMDRAVTEGIFSINNVMFYVDPDTDSMSTVLSRINSSSAGVTATYDSVNQQVNLVQNKTGAANQIVLGSTDDTSNFLYAAKMSTANPPVGALADTYSGTDAAFSINGGGAITSSDNFVDDVLPGISLQLTGTGNTTVAASQNKDAIKTAIKDFAAKYNDVMSAINSKLYEEKIPQSERKATADYFQGSLRGDSTLTSMRDSLASLVNGSVASLPSGMRMLEQAGIKMTVSADYKTSTMTVDEAKLDEKLSSDFTGVKNLFYDNDGFASRFYNAATGFISVNGVVSTEKTSLEAVITADNNRVTEYEERIKETEKRLKLQFSRMESALATMKNQQSWLASMASGLSVG